MISIIIPTWNAPEQLERCLTAIDRQRNNAPCEVIVADDGSVPSAESIAKRYRCRYGWQQHEGFRAAAARNLGARFATGSYLWFLDQDVLLNPRALEHAYDLTNRFAGAFILGRYDWLKPMKITCEDVIYRWDDVVAGKLPALPVKGDLGRVGPDPRCPERHPRPEEEFLPDWRHGALSGNILVPTDIFRSLGGFDDTFVGHGCEDLEFATRAQWSGCRAIFTSKIVGYHVWHERNQAQNVASVRRNLVRMWEKLDIEKRTGQRLTKEILDSIR